MTQNAYASYTLIEAKLYGGAYENNNYEISGSARSHFKKILWNKEKERQKIRKRDCKVPFCIGFVANDKLKKHHPFRGALVIASIGIVDVPYKVYFNG